MTIETGNLLAPLAQPATAEQLTTLLATANFRVERIVSHGHATPKDTWFDQDQAEWVLLVQGSAELLFEHEGAARALMPGDYVHIPDHVRHRVTATDSAVPTV